MLYVFKYKITQQLYFIIIPIKPKSISYKYIMYKLWRRELSKPTTSDQNAKRKQNQFTQLLFQIIKIMRKKQEFYVRVLFTDLNNTNNTTTYATDTINIKNHMASSIRQHTSTGFGSHQTINSGQVKRISSINIFELQNQQQGFLGQQEQIISSIKGYQQQSFFLSKTYLYTMFVRLLQIFDYSRQKISLKIKNQQQVYYKNWQKLYEDNKHALTDCYQNLVYFQNFNVLQLASIALKKQNHRIFSIVPTKIKKNQISLKPLVRVNSTQMKKSYSIEVKVKKDELIDIINKKLQSKPKKLQTQKRMEQKQKKKKKQKPVTLKDLYGILGIKIPKIEQGNAFRRQMQIDALERNQGIQEQRKKWQKKWQQQKAYPIKLINYYNQPQ